MQNQRYENLHCRNVNDGFIRGLDVLNEFRDDVKGSRVGQVIEAPCPVATVYHNPTERVLFALNLAEKAGVLAPAPETVAPEGIVIVSPD